MSASNLPQPTQPMSPQAQPHAQLLVDLTHRPADHGRSMIILRHCSTCQGDCVALRRSIIFRHYPNCKAQCVTFRRSIILRHHWLLRCDKLYMVLVAGGLTYAQPSLWLPQDATMDTRWHLLVVPTPESCKRYRANPALTPDSGSYLYPRT